MTLSSSKTPQTQPEAKTSWADVARVSSQKKEERADSSLGFTAPDALGPPSADSFPGGKTLMPGDQVDHPKFGRCTVHRIVGDFVHLAPVNGRVIRLSQNIVSFTPALIEKGRRVFYTSTQQ